MRSTDERAAAQTASGDGRSATPIGRVAQPRRLGAQHAKRDGRVVEQELLQPSAGDDEAAQVRSSARTSDARRLAVQDRDLAEELAAAEARELAAVASTTASPSTMTCRPPPARPRRSTRWRGVTSRVLVRDASSVGRFRSAKSAARATGLVAAARVDSADGADVLGLLAE